MREFKWVIEDASDEPMNVVDGGEVQIDGLKITNVKTWKVEEPNQETKLEPINGGMVEKVQTAKKVKRTPSDKLLPSVSSKDITRFFYLLLILLIAVMFGTGFLAVVIKGVIFGQLDFQTYMTVLTSFLAGLGISKILNAGNDSG